MRRGSQCLTTVANVAAGAVPGLTAGAVPRRPLVHRRAREFSGRSEGGGAPAWLGSRAGEPQSMAQQRIGHPCPPAGTVPRRRLQGAASRGTLRPHSWLDASCALWVDAQFGSRSRVRPRPRSTSSEAGSELLRNGRSVDEVCSGKGDSRP